MLATDITIGSRVLGGSCKDHITVERIAGHARVRCICLADDRRTVLPTVCVCVCSQPWPQTRGGLEGLTKSSPFMTLIQIFSRIFVVALLDECPAHVKGDITWIPMMIFAWSLADTTRYVYYAFSVLREIAVSAKSVAVALKMIKMSSVERADDPAFAIPFPLVWLRYSLFIVLYPMGVAGELNVIRLAMECLVSPMTAQQPATFSAWLLQTMRLIFRGWGYWPVFSTISLAYVFGLPSLYLMLWGARKKQLGKTTPDLEKKMK